MQRKIISVVMMCAILVGMILAYPANVNTYASEQLAKNNVDLSLCELVIDLEEENPETLVYGKKYTVNIRVKNISVVDELFFVMNFNPNVLRANRTIRKTEYEGDTNFDNVKGQVAFEFSSELDADNRNEAIYQIVFEVIAKEGASHTDVWLSDINPAYRGVDLYDGVSTEKLTIGNSKDETGSDDSNETEKPAVNEKFQLQLQDMSATKDVVVPLQVIKNTGVNGIGIAITFDSDYMTFERLSVAQDFKNKITLQSIYEVPGEGRIGASFLANEVMSDTGVFANVHFSIKDGVATGVTIPVEVEVVQATTADETIAAGNKVSATITVEKEQSLAKSVGDVDEDGKISLLDGMFILRYYNGEKKLTESQMKAADTNGDGSVNLLDALQILRYFNGEIKEF